MPQYLYRPSHGHSQNVYVRLGIPIDIQRLTRSPKPKKEFRKSTGTADLKRAKTVGAQLIAEKRKEWSDLLAKQGHTSGVKESVLTQSLVDHVCAKRLYQWMHLDDLARVYGEGMTEENIRNMTKMCAVTDQVMRSVLTRGKQSKEWQETIELLDLWCNQIEFKFSHADPLYPRLVREFAKVDIEGQGRVMKRNRGEPAETPPMPLENVATLSTMTELYRAHKQQDAGPKHVGTTVNVWKLLIANCGDIPLDQITSNDLFDFIEARMHADHKPWSMDYAQGVVKGTLREVFALARTKNLMTGKNPVSDLDVMPRLTRDEEAAHKKPRHPLTSLQLTTIFSSAWYTPSSNLWRGKMRKDLGARYWVPLICMFHGSRVREVLQLVSSDIGQQDGVDVLKFQKQIEGQQLELLATGASRSLKNIATHRVVPIHPKLLDLGFIDFVQQRKTVAGPNAMLFPSSLPAPGGKTPILGRAYEEAFLRYLRDGLEFGRGFGNHSFRHQLEDRIRDAQRPGKRWPAGLAQAYTGRKRLRDADVGRIDVEGSEAAYGRGHGPDTMLLYIEGLDFQGVKLPPTYKNWLTGSKN
jgi:integrase